MKTRFNHDVRKKCVIVNASELGEVTTLLLNFFASIMSTPFHAISRIILRCISLTNTAKKSELKTKKVGTCQDDDFFALLSTFRAF